MDNEARSNFRTWGDYQIEWTSQRKDSNYRTESLTRLSDWLKGVQTPPDGMVPADVLVRGISWGGWDWKKRDIEWLEDPNKTLPMIERLLASLEEHIHNASRADSTIYPPESGIRLNPFGYVPNGADEKVVDAVLSGVDLRDSLMKERSAWEELLRVEADCRREFAATEITEAKKKLDAQNGSADGTNHKKRTKHADATDAEKKMLRAFLNAKFTDKEKSKYGFLNARKVKWETIVTRFEQWAATPAAKLPKGFPNLRQEVITALKRISRAMTDAARNSTP